MVRAWFILGLVAGSCWFGLVQSASGAAVGLERVASGLNRPIYVTHAPGDEQRLFIVEKGGTIKIMDLATGAINSTPFLTVPDTDASGNEEGLLGLAFHPEYATNGKFYINVTVDDDGGVAATRTHIREYTVSSNPDVALPTPIEVLGYNQPQENHNGGWLGFSPNDGYLYIMAGDGGGGNDGGATDVNDGHTDGTGNAQDITSNLLGKALRIDVDGTNGSTGNYGNPIDNPFVGVTGDDEIWAYGLRNPWRASFDRQTGDLWIGDVGQGAREEIDFQPASSEGGENYGWRLREGSIATPTVGVGGPPPTGNVDPIYDYGHVSGDFGGNVVAGGYVYRGPDPELQGFYYFADTGSANIWTLDPSDNYETVDQINSDIPPDVGSASLIVSFGEDSVGNLYLVKIGTSSTSTTTGAIYKLVTDAFVPGDFNADGLVDGDDLSRWQAGYGTLIGSENANGDADGDGDVDGRDFLAWQRNLGVSSQDFTGDLTSPAVAVPEPGTVILLGMTVVCCRRRSARRA
jgi:glucose/arabinose dehydrogenase